MNEPPELPPLSKPAPAIADDPKNILEQYKAYLSDLGNIGTRYTTANCFYVSVITALLAVLALTKKDEGYYHLQTLLGITIPLFAIGLCLVWSQTVVFYGRLFKVKFDILRELERLGGLHNVFEREELQFRPRPWLLRNERFVPLLLALPFVIIMLAEVGRVVRHCLWANS